VSKSVNNDIAKMISSAKLKCVRDKDGDLINDFGDVFYCNNSSLCDAVARHRVVVSVDKPHDDIRHLCDSCFSAYQIGVQHGRFHEARRLGVQVGDDSSQSTDAFV